MRITSLSVRRKRLIAIGFDLPPEELPVGEDLPPARRFDPNGLLLLDRSTVEEAGLAPGASLSEEALRSWEREHRALLAAVPEDEKTAWVDGMKLVSKQLYETLYKAGLEEIQAEGQFDPELHDAVMQEENEDKESGEIIDVFQKGYKVKNRIIRHSMVKVAK